MHTHEQQIRYSSLQQNFNKQFKDLAFFQILKRKGPYIERSVTKIQNDLFHKHKLSKVKIKNVSFIKDIRMTMAAYQIIINQIKNDFLMTELDSLGDSIHKLFTQMISIINFFSSVILKREKLALNDLIDLSIEELKEKQLTIKKLEQEQKAKLSQEKQRENQLLKEIERLNFNFRELFKAQNDSNKHNQLVQDLWKAIVLENKNSVQKALKFQDSDLTRIIQDSSDYLLARHSELDNVVRHTRQCTLFLTLEIVNSEKTLNGFTDKAFLIEENQHKIEHMKQVATQIVDYVRERVYDKKNVQIQTMLTLIDNTRPYMTTKQLDEKRKMQLKIKNFEKTFKEKQTHIDCIQRKLKEAEDKLRIFQNQYDGRNESDSEQESFKNIRNYNLARTFMNKIGRNSKQSGIIPFKITPTSKVSGFGPKTREASFTMAKKSRKSQKNLTINLKNFNQKSSKRTSSNSKELGLGNRNSNGNDQSSRNMLSNGDSPSTPHNRKTNFKKFYKIRDSNLVTQVKSFEETSKKSHLSKPQGQFKEEENSDEDGGELRPSIHETKSCRQPCGNQRTSILDKNGQNGISNKQPVQKNSLSFTISQSFKINIRPKLAKRYLQSAKKGTTQNLGSSQNYESGEGLSKENKSVSHKQISRYFFEPLNDLQRHVPPNFYRPSVSRTKACSSKATLNKTFGNITEANVEKVNRNSSQERQQRSTVPELNAISFVKLKNEKLNNSSSKQNSSILKGSTKKQSQKSILKKSSTTKQNVSFAFLPGSEKKRRQSMYSSSKENKWSKERQRNYELGIVSWQESSSRLKHKNGGINESTVIQQQNQVEA